MSFIASTKSLRNAWGKPRANRAMSPSGTNALNISRASPDIALSMRWSAFLA